MQFSSNIGIVTSLYNTINVSCDVKITYHKTIRHVIAKSIEMINHDAIFCMIIHLNIYFQLKLVEFN